MGGDRDERSQEGPVRGFDEACETIARMLAAHAEPRPVVGITGPVASGKSTLADRLSRELIGLTLSTDRYLPDYQGLSPAQRDQPASSDLARLADDLAMLRRDGHAAVPVWSFHEHRRTGEERVRAAGPIICEGLFALQPAVLESLTIRVFVEAPSPERWARWEAIERAGERGWGVERAREHFHTVAEPTFDQFAPQYRAAADLVVLNEWRSPA